MGKRNIELVYVSVDSSKIKKTYKTLSGAQKFSTEMVGEYPGLGSGYAVSDDGVGILWYAGCNFKELFPKTIF